MRKAKTAKRLSSLLVVFALLASIFPMGAFAASADKFTDVSRKSWYYDYVDYVVDKGYFNGTSDTTFTPDGTMTRAMFVTVLARMDGAKVDNSTSAFDDVPVGTWYTGAVTWASVNGIVNGYGNGRYEPDRAITREEMCVIMDRFIQYYGAKHNLTPKRNGSTEAFPDGNQIAAYASAAVANCRAYGLVEGYDGGYFLPQNDSTRAQVAAVIYRLAWLTIESHNGGNGGGSVVVIPTSSYTITYYKNDGTADVFTSDVTESVTASSKSFTVTSSVPTREGYTFMGWNTAADGTGTSYTAGAKYSIMGNLSLYAIWEPETNPDDLVGNAVAATVADVNSKYETMKSAVINAVESMNGAGGYLTEEQLAAVKSVIREMVSVQTVTYDQSKTGSRTVSASVSLSVTEDQAVSAIEAATELAKNLLSGIKDDFINTPSMDDVDGFIAAVKEAVEKKTGITITDQSLAEIKTQVVDKLMAEGKKEWANFYDETGYYCGDITVEANGCTVVIKVDDAGKTTTLGSVTDMNGNSVTANKTNAVKYLGEAIAKDMLAQVKTQSNGEYIDDPSMTGKVTVTFAPSATEEYAEMQFSEDGSAIYPNVYEVSLTVDLDSDGLVSYKWDNSENYLKLTITEEIQKVYNSAIDEVAAQYADDPETKADVVKAIQDALPDKVDALVGKINEQLAGYGVELDVADTAELKTALNNAVEKWVDANWTALVASLTSGTLNTDNTALIDAAWPVIEAKIPGGDDLDEVIQDQIEDQLDKNGITEKWIIEQANNNSVLKNAQELANKFTGTITSNGKDVTESLMNSINITSIADINTLMSFGVVTFDGTISMGDLSAPFKTTLKDSNNNDLNLGEYLKSEIVSMASEKLESALEGHATLSRLLADNPDAKDYFMYSAFVQVGLEFKNEQAEAAKDGATLTALRESIVDIAKAKATEELNDQIKAIDVTESLTDANETLQAYQDKITLLNSLKFNDTDGIQKQTFAGLAEKLKGNTLKEIVGSEGDAFVKQYLAVYVGKLMSKLPAGASITINDVKFDKNDLSGLSRADTTVGAIEAVANVINKLGTLSINSFDTDVGIPVKITYGGRNFEFNLVIDVE